MRGGGGKPAIISNRLTGIIATLTVQYAKKLIHNAKYT